MIKHQLRKTKLFYLRIKPFFKGSLGLIQKEFFPVRNAIPFTSGITALYFPIVVISLTFN